MSESMPSPRGVTTTIDDTLNVPADVRLRMLEDFVSTGIRDTERNRQLYLEAEEVKSALAEHGISFEMVKPTRDGRGYVRLNFESAWKLIDLIEEEDPE